MNLLLTGASGFLGKNFLLRLPAGWRVIALYRNALEFPEFVSGLNRPQVVAARCDLSDPEAAAALFERYGREWDACVYLAAKVDIPWSVREPKQDLLYNTAPLLNLLAHLHTGRFVYFSSGAVYDGLSGEVCANMPVAPTLPYAISKLACERYIEFYHRRRQSLKDYLIVRFFGAYGPHEAPNKIYTQLIRAFGFEGRESYTIYGDGRNLIDAMYIDEAVEALYRILAGNHWNDIIDLAAGNPLTIEELVKQAAAALGRGNIALEKLGVAHEHNNFWGSPREMRRLFGFEAKTSLSEGINRFYKFLVDKQPI